MIDTTGDAWCRGSNAYGEVGDGTASSRSDTYAHVVDLHDVTDIADRDDAACAVSGGGLYCWGRTSLDVLSGLDTRRPQRVPGIDDAVDVVLTRSFDFSGEISTGCVVRRSGDVLCWGSDQFGSAGDGLGGAQVDEPVEVQPMP